MNPELSSNPGGLPVLVAQAGPAADSAGGDAAGGGVAQPGGRSDGPTGVRAAVQNAEVKLVSPAVRDGGGAVFELPVRAEAVVGVELVDLDLILVLADGQRLLLPQGGVLAALRPELTVLRFADGVELPASEQYKRLGLVGEVAGGSFRIQASELTPVQASGAGSADAFGLEGDPAERVSPDAATDRAAAEQIQEIVLTLQAIAREQERRIDEAPPAGPGVSSDAAAGRPVDPFVPELPGQPPKPIEPPAKDGPENPDTPVLAVSRTSAIHSTDTGKASGLALVSAEGRPVAAGFGEITVDRLFPSSPLPVTAASGSEVRPFAEGVVELDLVVATDADSAAAIRLFPVASGETEATPSLPPGFRIEGQALSNRVRCQAVEG